LEPFGILQFLQTLLSDAQKNANPTQPNEQSDLRQNSPKFPTQTEDFNEITATETTENTPATESPPQKQDAILRFMENHDERAKKFKR